VLHQFGVSGYMSELCLFLSCLGEIWYKISVCNAVLRIFESVKIGGSKVKLYLWACTVNLYDIFKVKKVLLWYV
jgi:hypothetical protein